MIKPSVCHTATPLTSPPGSGIGIGTSVRTVTSIMDAEDIQESVLIVLPFLHFS